MKVIKKIINFKVITGGEQHTGWLPLNASKPQPTPVRAVFLNITIESDGFGYLLCYTSSDGSIVGDFWYEHLEDAESAAFEYFGVISNDWKNLI